jgi:hypothetical protein
MRECSDAKIRDASVTFVRETLADFIGELAQLSEGEGVDGRFVSGVITEAAM